MTREGMLQHLTDQGNEPWDVVIIGGGATGLGCAVDAATRGYKTLLVEQADFAKGTSSKSTKLVHGGVRYLAQGNLRLVSEALRERGFLLKNAPHLVKNISFIIPAYSRWKQVYYYLGLIAYDFLSGKFTFGKSEWLSAKETRRRIRTVNKKGLVGGVLYHDGQFDDARLAVNLAQTVADNGGTVLNYCRAEKFTKDGTGMISGVVLEDVLTGSSYTVKARSVINAAGVFADDVVQLDDPEDGVHLLPSQGVHVVVDGSFLPGEDALMIPDTSDGRVLFAIPWHGQVVIGTTDHLVHKKTLEPKPTRKEIDFILKNASLYLEKPVKYEDIRSTFAGLRPLVAVKDEKKNTKEISRGHEVIYSKSGLISVLGGKWTTYRKMAEDAVNLAATLGMLPQSDCRTRSLPVHGFCAQFDPDDPLHIYGADADEIKGIIAAEPEKGERIHPALPYTWAEVDWAIRHEMAMSVEDILCRRTRSIILDSRAAAEAAPAVARYMAPALGTDELWEKQEVENFRKLVIQYGVTPE